MGRGVAANNLLLIKELICPKIARASTSEQVSVDASAMFRGVARAEATNARASSRGAWRTQKVP